MSPGRVEIITGGQTEERVFLPCPVWWIHTLHEEQEKFKATFRSGSGLFYGATWAGCHPIVTPNKKRATAD
jgi:hypothetical protein